MPWRSNKEHEKKKKLWNASYNGRATIKWTNLLNLLLVLFNNFRLWHIMLIFLLGFWNFDVFFMFYCLFTSRCFRNFIVFNVADSTVLLNISVFEIFITKSYHILTREPYWLLILFAHIIQRKILFNLILTKYSWKKVYFCYNFIHGNFL